MNSQQAQQAMFVDDLHQDGLAVHEDASTGFILDFSPEIKEEDESLLMNSRVQESLITERFSPPPPPPPPSPSTGYSVNPYMGFDDQPTFLLPNHYHQDEHDGLAIYEDANTQFILGFPSEEEEEMQESLTTETDSTTATSTGMDQAPLEHDFVIFSEDDYHHQYEEEEEDGVSVYLDASTGFFLFPFDEEEEVEIVSLIEDSMRREPNYGMIPATMGSINGLERECVVDDVEDYHYSCPICLEEVACGSRVTRMPCCHGFHDECIVRWLMTSNCCPLCRYQLP